MDKSRSTSRSKGRIRATQGQRKGKSVGLGKCLRQ